MQKIYRLAIPLILVSFLTACSNIIAPTVVAAGVGAGIYVSQDRRSASTIVDDKTIQIKASTALMSDSNIRKYTKVSVTSFDGLVLITGQSINEELKDEIHDIVSKISSVRKVYNEVTIEEPLTFKESANDAFITSSVKTNLFRSKAVDASKVKVVTENRVVFLLGILTDKEAAAATEIARSTDGVKAVVKIFEPHYS